MEAMSNISGAHAAVVEAFREVERNTMEQVAATNAINLANSNMAAVSGAIIGNLIPSPVRVSGQVIRPPEGQLVQDLREENRKLRSARQDLEGANKFLKRQLKWSKKKTRDAESKAKDADFFRTLLEELLAYGFINLPNPDDEGVTQR